MERLKRSREPAVVVALVGLVLRLVLSVLWAVGSPAPLGSTLASLATLIAEPVLLAVLTALLVTCWLPEPSPHVRGLTVAGLVLTAAVLIGVIALTLASWASTPTGSGDSSFILGLVAPVTVATISVGIQAALLRRPAPEPAAGSEPAAAELEPVDPQQQPTWTPDAAVGTVWRRAGDAASQTPATAWDAPGQADGGWGPGAPVDQPPEPTRRADDQTRRAEM